MPCFSIHCGRHLGASIEREVPEIDPNILTMTHIIRTPLKGAPELDTLNSYLPCLSHPLGLRVFRNGSLTSA